MTAQPYCQTEAGGISHPDDPSDNPFENLTVRETEDTIEIPISPKMYPSASQFVRDAMVALLERSSDMDPREIYEEHRRIDDVWGGGYEFSNTARGLVLDRAVTLGLVVQDVASQIRSAAQDGRNLASCVGGGAAATLAMPLIFAGSVFSRRKEAIDSLDLFARRLGDADPYVAMMLAATNEVDNSLRSVDSNLPSPLPRNIFDEDYGGSICAYIRSRRQAEVEYAREDNLEIFQTIDLRIKTAIQESGEGEVPIFAVVEGKMIVEMSDIKDSGAFYPRFERKGRSDLMPDILHVYREALAFIATAGNSVVPDTHHLESIEKSRGVKYRAGRLALAALGDIDELDSISDLVFQGDGSFDNAAREVREYDQERSKVASTLVVSALAPVVAEVVESKGQFVSTGVYPLHPAAIIFRDPVTSEATNMFGGIGRVLDGTKEKLGGLGEQTQGESFETKLLRQEYESIIAVGTALLKTLGTIGNVFQTVTPVQMDGMLPSGAEGQNQESLLRDIVVMKPVLADAIDNLDRVVNATAAIETGDFEGEGDDYFAALERILGKQHEITYQWVARDHTLNVSGSVLLSILNGTKIQDEGGGLLSPPAGLRNAVASCFLRKLVGYPPSLNKVPDILGELSELRVQQLRELKAASQGGDSFMNILDHRFFDADEARLIIRNLIRTMRTHSDIGNNPALGELNLIYIALLVYLRTEDTGGGAGAGMDGVSDL